MSIEGEHLLNWRYTCMNSIGQTAVAVNVESCSYNDATLVEAHRTQRLVAQREGHAPCELATVDNPHKDQAGVSAALWAGDGKHTFRFPADGEIKMIVTQEECDEACSHLRTFAEIGFDTESIAYIDGSGSNAKHAAVAQLCGDGKVCYIFLLYKWKSCYRSFTSLMATPSPKKIANNISHDISHLQERFPAEGRRGALTVNGALELSDLVPQNLKKRSLQFLVGELLGEYLDKQVSKRPIRFQPDLPPVDVSCLPLELITDHPQPSDRPSLVGGADTVGEACQLCGYGRVGAPASCSG